MKPAPFTYVRAQSMPDVFEYLETHGDDAAILAGGQSLMPTLNMRLSAPKVVIDINALAGDLAGIEVRGSTIRIGALTRHSEVAASAAVAQHLPLIASAMPHIAHRAVRNRGTFGGSVALADPAAELPACVLALEGRIIVRSRSGERVMAAGDFFHGMFETALADTEVLTAVEFDVADTNARAGFQEFSRRHGDYAMTGLALQAVFDGASTARVRPVYFAISDRPVLAAAAAAELEGTELTADDVARAEAALDTDLRPEADLNASAAMKLHLAKILLRRTVAGLVAP